MRKPRSFYLSTLILLFASLLIGCGGGGGGGSSTSSSSGSAVSPYAGTYQETITATAEVDGQQFSETNQVAAQINEKGELIGFSLINYVPTSSCNLTTSSPDPVFKQASSWTGFATASCTLEDGTYVDASIEMNMNVNGSMITGGAKMIASSEDASILVRMNLSLNRI